MKNIQHPELTGKIQN